ncbi:MAG: UbiA family prenyltransferase [Verrucomicrobiota bacterium]|jgi:4-hydroxybenzoate polyprenyltransferase
MKPWLQLARISNLPTVWTNVTAAWLLAGGALQDTRLYWLLLAGSLLYTGGMILNDAADAKFDREHRRERPIPSGRVNPTTAWSVAIVLLLAGATLATGFGAIPRITAFLVTAIVFYDLYHKQWDGSVIIMGACRTLLYLMAASAVTPAIDKVFLPALALGGYVVGVTLAARLEHQNGALPPLSALLAFGCLYLPAIVCARGFATGHATLGQLIILGVFAMLVAYATQTMRKGGPGIGKAVGLLLAGIPLVDALAVSSVSLPLAVVFAALVPLLRLWQRWIAAT